MRKLGLICVALLLALGVLGITYGSWSQKLNTSAAVSIAQAPAVSAGGASVNTGTGSATLNGSLTQTAPGNAAVSVGFQYWDTTAPGVITTVPAGSVSSLNSTFSATITGLTAGHIYGYQSTGVGLFTVNSPTSTFTVNSTLAITTGSLPNGTTGVPYSQLVQATGGSGTYTSWTISSGALPNGLSLHSGNIISGTPTAAGTFSFAVKVTDSAGANATATLSITIIPAAFQLVFDQQPTNTAVGAYISPAVIVKIEDASGNPVTSPSVPVTMAIANNPSGGNLYGTLTVNSVNGFATFSNLSINKTGNGYTLTAAGSGLAGATSSPFNVIPGSLYQLSLETKANGSGGLISAQNFTAGSGGTVAVYAIERDSIGAFVANIAGSWSLANVTGGLVNSELAPAGDGKSAVFTAGTAAGSATIHVVWDGLSADSGTISVTSTAAKLVFTTEPGATAAAGAAFTTQPVVTVEDVSGNPVTNYSGTISLAITSGTGTTGAILSATANPVTVINGIASFSGVSINWAGNGYKLTASGGGFNTASTSITITAITRIYVGTGTNDLFSRADHWTGGSVPGPGDNIIILNTCNFDDAANNFVYGNLTLGNGTTNGILQWPSGGTNTLQVSNVSAANTSGTSQILMPTGITGTLQVSGTTTVGSNLSISASAGTQNFNGAVTINSGGIITETAPVTLSFGSDIVINSLGTLTENGALTVGVAGSLTDNGTYNAGTGMHTFTGSGMTITGSTNPIVIPSVTVTGIYTSNCPFLSVSNVLTVNSPGVLTNSGTLATSSLAGTGSLIQAASISAILDLGGTSTTITTLNATAAGNTVNYYTGAQTVFPTTYANLTLSNSGVKTTASVTVNGVLSMEGTATVSVAPTYGLAATLQYNTTASRTSGTEWITPFVSTGGVIITNTGTITLNAAKVFNASVPLTINSGATLNTNATNNYTLTFGGNFVNNGTLTANASPIVITNTMPTQSIAGFTTTGLVSMTKTSGTATFTGNVSGAGLTINGSGGTLDLGSGMTHTFTGVVTLTAGSLNGDSSMLNENATSITAWNGTGSLFTAGTGTVIFGGAAQTLSASATTFNNLTFSNSGVKTLTTANCTVNSILSMEGTATASAAPTYGAAATLQYNTSTARNAGPEWITPFVATGGVIIANTGTITLNVAKVFNASVPLTINSGATLNTNATNNYTLTFGGNFVNNGTFTSNASPIVIANTMATQSIAGFTTTGTVSMTKTAGTATFTGNVNGGAFTLSGSGGTLNLDAGTTGLTHTFAGTFTRTNGILNCSLSTLNLNGTTSGTGGIFNPGTGTVTYGGTAAQTIANVNYYNLGFSGARTTTSITINGAVGVAGTLNNGASFSTGNFVLTGSTFTFNGTGHRPLFR